MEYVSLHNGMLLPKIGLGTYTISDSRQIVSALDEGYRLFDSAVKYDNEKEIGNAILLSGYKDTCVISKISGEHYLGRKRYLYMNRKSVKHCLRISQRNMQQCGPQIYLLHYLFKNHIEAYKELLALYEEGKIRAIGVSNFYPDRLVDFVGFNRIKPMVNQIERHLLNQRKEDITPYWRTLKSDGRLNEKYPEGINLQKKLLEEEGYEIISKGTKNIKYYVKDFEKYLIEL